MTARASLLGLVKRIVERDPVAAVRHLESLPEREAAEVMKALPPTLAAQMLPHLQAGHAYAYLSDVPTETFSELAKRLPPEQAASALLQLEEEPRQALLDSLPENTRRAIQELLTYPENSAGRILNTTYLAFRDNLLARDAVQRIRSLPGRPPTPYAYVVDEQNHLVGVLNMWDLLLSRPEAPLKEVMRTEVIYVNAFTDREEVAHLLSRKHLSAAPVVDMERKLLGVVKTDELIGDVQEETTEDILKMVGAGGDERTFSSLGFSIKKRLPWLHVNLATAFLASAVVALFEDLIAKITVLAVFLPVVAGQGGNAGAQSLAVVMRGLVLREIRPSNAWRLIGKETFLGIVNGAVIGVVTAAVAWAWHGSPMLGLVIGLAMVVNLGVAGLSGAAIPLVMKAVGFDPAQSSNIILTTVTDVIGFLAFLGFALIFQGYLS